MRNMKKIAFAAVMCVAVVVCTFANEDLSKPVRQGGVDGQAFWNGHADWFLYPPSFDFQVVPDAVRYRCYHPIDASAAKLIRTYLALYRASGNATDLAKARALGDSLVNLQDPDGRIPTHWNKKHFHDRDYDWVNCMLAAASALEQLANFSDVPRAQPTGNVAH